MALTLDYHQHVVLVKLNLCPPEYQDWKESSFLSRITPLCRRFLLKAGGLRFLPVYLNRMLRRLRNIVVGFVVTVVILTVFSNDLQMSDNQIYRSTYAEKNDVNIVPNGGLDKERTWLYVGVLSAGHFLDERARHVWKTWGSGSPFLEVFTGTTDITVNEFPVVQLSGVDETEYPPQHKSFAMLRFMCDHRLEDYDWFMRADDDVYVKMERLHSLLQTLDSNEAIYLGQSGYGRAENQNTLGLEGHSFCMGGPGVILSRTAMKGLCRVLSACQLDVISAEEDVEIGRCMHHLGLQCTRAKQMTELFFHSYPQQHPANYYLQDLSSNLDFTKAITLHPAKEPALMWNIHLYHLLQQMSALKQKATLLAERLNSNQKKHLTCLNDALLNLAPPETEEDPSTLPPQKFVPDLHGNETHVCFESDCRHHGEWLSFINKVKQQLVVERKVKNLLTPSQLKDATIQFQFTRGRILFQMHWTSDQTTNRSLFGTLVVRL